jgi:HEAT repeat protein
LELATQFRGARKGEPEYYLRIRSLSVLGVWKSVEALPMLLEGVASEDEEVRIRSVLAIGQIDAAANKAVLLRALRDEYFPVRAAAAKGLSQTEDPQVLLELEVQASRERSRGAWREILESATLLRERIAGKGK